ncbi:MAG: ATP-binding cassette domain-containing protein [Patescibacteria group bacterium]
MDRVVVVDHLVKNFEVNEKGRGLAGTLSSLISPKKRIVQALKEISFSVKKGELVGFIGPNGAGKTTTLKILSGILYPTSGFVQVAGYTPWERKEDFLKQISLIMGQKNQLWWDLPAIETFELNRAIYEIPERIYKRSLDELVTLLDVEDILTVPVRRLSLGQRMRMELIAALLHRPEVIFLDEPTIGLDLVAQKTVRDFINDYNRKNEATILLTSHNMDDVAGLAKRVVVIDEGSIIFDGKLEELIGHFAKEKEIKVFFKDGADYKKLEGIGKVKKVKHPEVIISVPRHEAAAAAGKILENFQVEDLTITEESLDDIIRKVFQGKLGKV